MALMLAFVGHPGVFAQTTSPTISAAAGVPLREPGDQLPLHPERHLRFSESEGTWMSLDVSPDGQTIAFELLGDLYTMSVRGGDAHCVACGLPFDSQPAFSPDGSSLALVSDRSGNENLWVSRTDGSDPRLLSHMDDNSVFVSPAWAADGRSVYVSRYTPDLNAFELWQYDLSGGDPHQVTRAKSAPDTPKESRMSALGASASTDGRWLFYAAKTGLGFDDDLTFPLWHIVRRNLHTGDEDTFVEAQGSAFRPAISPDGRSLIYGTRVHGRTTLRIRGLVDGSDSLLLDSVPRDDQEGSASRDLLPRFAFSPDSRFLYVNSAGKIERVELATRAIEGVPFVAHVDLPLGPLLRQEIGQETGAVRARLIQTPSASPDGRKLAFSALGHVYVTDLKPGNQPRRLTASEEPEFDPSWSPDGRSLVYVTWTDRGGDIWRTSVDGNGLPQRLTEHTAAYSFPVFTPDGRSIVALRRSTYERNHHYMELPPGRAEILEMPAGGGAFTLLASGVVSNIPQFTNKTGVVYVSFSDGLYELPLYPDAPRRRVLDANGPAWYFVDGGLSAADAIKISPDGHWALAQITEQLYLIQLPTDGRPLSIELGKASPLETRITSTGADFFDWADAGQTITWAIGSTFFRQPLSSIRTGSVDPPATPDRARPRVEATEIVVELPRDLPTGTLVLRGATAITMHNGQVIPDADVVVTGNHLAAIGPRGSVRIPANATIRDVSGMYVTPGFTDTHMHWADVRRGILDLQSWGFRATLAYGVTSGLDPSPLSVDMLAYQDLLDAGLMVGSRVYSTGPAVFSFNQFHSAQQTMNVLERYPTAYRTRNLKEYRTGNRRQREWVLEASAKLHLLTTTEGALDMKLDMTQIQDGFPGNEHALTATPLADDMVQLVARSGVSYTPTLQISNGGLPAQEFFFSTASPADDPKLRHFEPGFFLDGKLDRLRWALPREYAFSQIARDAANIERAGGLIGVGSHGEVPGLGFHLELQALASGGMAPQDVLYAATMGSSRTIGRDAEFGSLEAGKYADLLLMSRNPLVDIKNTLSLRSVMKNGRLYDADTLDEQWPDQRSTARLWFQDQR